MAGRKVHFICLRWVSCLASNKPDLYPLTPVHLRLQFAKIVQRTGFEVVFKVGSAAPHQQQHTPGGLLLSSRGCRTSKSRMWWAAPT